MKRKYFVLLFVFAIFLCGCKKDNSVDISKGFVKIGSVYFKTENTVEKVEMLDELSYLFTLIDEEAYMSVVAADVSSLDQETGFMFSQMQQEQWLDGYPDRFHEATLNPMIFGDTKIPIVSYGVTRDGVTTYNVTGSFYYEGFSYTIHFFSYQAETKGTEKFIVMMQNTAFFTTGEIPVTLPTETASYEDDNATLELPKNAMNNEPTLGEKNALKEAKSRLEYSAYSYNELMRVLMEYDGYTLMEARYGVNNCGADWYEQAVKSAQDRLEYSAYSKAELTEVLIKYDGFTQEQAKHAVRKVGY